MKALDFIEGAPPKGFKKDSESFLFNTAEYRELAGSEKIRSFHLLDAQKKKISASIHFHLSDAVAESPASAPFGSIELADSMSLDNLYEFISQIEVRLRSEGVNKIKIKHPAQGYNSALAAVTEVLFINLGYNIVTSEINAAIPVNKKKFEDHISDSEHRKLKQAKKAGLEFYELGMKHLAEVYNFILSCRNERGQSLSMSLENLQRTIKSCGKSFFLFGVYSGKELVAASVSIRVSHRILYNFYPAHSRKTDSISPAVFLTMGIYEWCQDYKIELLDLGTSALDNKPNFSLLEFKTRLGGILSAKNTYEKELK